METTVYAMRLSHPAQSAELMLAHKGIKAERIEIPPGSQRVLMRRHGFKGGIVPGMKIDGKRFQGTLEISRALEEAQLEPRLFPEDRDARDAVEVAELWGEQTFQPVPRRIFRWKVSSDSVLRTTLAKTMGLPAPSVAQWGFWPVAQFYVRYEGGGEKAARRDLAELPTHLDHIDGLIADGVIGGSELNAADFQIAPSTRVLMNFPQLRPLIESRPAGEHAMRVAPDFGRELPVKLPEEWLPA